MTAEVAKDEKSLGVNFQCWSEYRKGGSAWSAKQGPKVPERGSSRPPQVVRGRIIMFVTHKRLWKKGEREIAKSKEGVMGERMRPNMRQSSTRRKGIEQRVRDEIRAKPQSFRPIALNDL